MTQLVEVLRHTSGAATACERSELVGVRLAVHQRRASHLTGQNKIARRIAPRNVLALLLVLLVLEHAQVGQTLEVHGAVRARDLLRHAVEGVLLEVGEHELLLGETELVVVVVVVYVVVVGGLFGVREVVVLEGGWRWIAPWV